MAKCKARRVVCPVCGRRGLLNVDRCVPVVYRRDLGLVVTSEGVEVPKEVLEQLKEFPAAMITVCFVEHADGSVCRVVDVSLDLL